MRWKTTIILLVLVLAVGFYIWFYERKAPTAEERARLSKKVLCLRSRDIDKLKIKRGKEEIVLTRGKRDRWQMESPISARADTSEVDSILYKFEFLQKERTLKAEKDKPLRLEEFGLKKPHIVATIEARGKSHTVNIGRQTPVGDNIYMQLAGSDEVIVVEKSLAKELEKSVTNLRERTVLEVDKFTAERVEIKFPERILEAAKRDEKWRLLQPIPDRADKAKVDELLDKIGSAEVADFISDEPEDLAEYGLDKPLLEVSVTHPEDTPGVGEPGLATILFGRTLLEDNEKIYCKRKGIDSIYSVKAGILKDLDKAPEEIRDKKIASAFEKNKVTRLEIKKEDETISLAKKEDAEEWDLTSPREFKAEAEAVTDFLQEILDLEIKEFPDDKGEDLARYGLKEPAVEIAWKLKEGDGEKIFIGSLDEAGNNVFVRREKEPPVFAVRGNFRKEALRTYLAYRDRTILKFDRDKAEIVTIERQGKTWVVEKDAEDKWQLIQPVITEAETYAVDDILWELSNLKAERLIAEGVEDFSPYGLDKPGLKAVVQFKKEEGEEEAARLALLVAKRGEDEKYYGCLEGQDLLFTISSALLSTLKKELHKCTVLEFEKDKAQSLVIKRKDAILNFTKEDDKWGLDGKEADRDKIDDLLYDLSNLRTERFLDYEAADFAPYGLDEPAITVEISLPKEKKVLIIGAKRETADDAEKKDGKYCAAARGEKKVFLLSKYLVENLTKETGDFLTADYADLKD